MVNKNNIKRVVVLCLIATLFFNSLFSQNKENSSGILNFKYPLDIKMNLSANYGELRSNHFHNGIDFRVGGVVGAPVFATEDGYISRIVVSPTGYGNGLYITHKNGFVSVYGHLHCFTDKIEKFVTEKQYKEESFIQDIRLSEDVFPIKRGEQIGKAGNTGSSGGPHLHFEIRDSLNQPLNVFKRGFLNIKDNTSPIFNGIAFYGYKKKGDVVQKYYIGKEIQGKKYISDYSNSDIVILPDTSYIAIDAVDKMEGTPAKLAVEEYNIFLDNKLIFNYKVGEVPFNKGKYINSFLEYRQMAIKERAFIKSYLEPGNILKDNVKSVDNGLIILKDTLPHKIKIEVADYLNNRAVKTFNVKKDNTVFSTIKDSLQGDYIAWYLPGIISKEDIDIYIPIGALYSSMHLYVDTICINNDSLSTIWRIGDKTVPLHKPITVSIKNPFPDKLIDKIILIKIDDKGSKHGIIPKYDSLTKKITTNIYSFGNYTLGIDAEAPNISTKLQNGASIKRDNIIFIVKDNLSGIKKYRVEIDGKWVLAQYDAKTNRVIIPLKLAKIKKGKHKITIKVEDGVGNKTSLCRNFIWNAV